jgi:hypothetical protein
MCASSNCAIGICCGEGEFADPASLSCSREPVALVLPVATAELDLDQAFELPVRIVNPLDTVQTFRLAATGGASLSVPPGPFVVLPGESAATRISVAGARLGSTTFLVEAANELGTLRTQRAVTLVSSSSASPLGVQVRTAPDVGAAQALALALAAGALVLARRRTPRSPVRG